MEKTHSTNIGGRIFEVEEDAYQQLTAYLATIATRFSAYPDAKEIFADIEARIAEHLLQNSGSSRIVTREDVVRVINAMGRADQFGDTAEVPSAARSTTRSTTGENANTGAKSTNFTGAPRAAEPPSAGPASAGPAESMHAYGIARPRLFRDRDERVVAGVASGIAAYYDISPTWIRLLFLFSLFLGGTGFLVYIILWMCVPPARTLTDRVRMRGERVTLNTIDQGLRDESLATPPNPSHTTFFRILIAGVGIIAILCMGMCIGAIGNGVWTWTYNNPHNNDDTDSSIESRVRIDTVFAVAGTPTVDLSTVAGDINVTTWPQSQVKVIASTSGDAEVDLVRTGTTVKVHERIPHHFCGSCATTIDVTVPPGTSVVTTTISGSQTVMSSRGNVRANSTSGDIEIHSARTVTANAVSGDITVTLPSSQHATINASSTSGDIDTDFSNNDDRESGIGKHVVIPVNGGGDLIQATTVSGDIAVRRKS